MKVKSIVECSLGAFCNTFDLHLEAISLESQFWYFLSGRLRQILLYINKGKNLPMAVFGLTYKVLYEVGYCCIYLELLMFLTTIFISDLSIVIDIEYKYV